MKKTFVILATLFVCGSLSAQVYYNEWIDYNRTYYKMKIGVDALYRIPASQLSALGMQSVAVENFQLWRNGKQVPLFTSVSTGSIGTNGYIEFWGQKNDGVTDIDLYRKPEYQLSDRVSLLTDTAALFLTYNSTGNNLRYAATANNVSGNTLPAEPSFRYAARKDFREIINKGTAIYAGEYVYSSSYDIGEMWSTDDIYANVSSTGETHPPKNISFTDLNVEPTGTPASFRISVAGSSIGSRTYKVDLNGTKILETNILSQDARIDQVASVPVSLIASNVASIDISSVSSSTNRMVCGFVELNYSRKFNFGNQKNFEFKILPSSSNKYVEIANFNAGNATPVLYDYTNNRRYVADVSAGLYRFVLQPSADTANFVLVSEDANNLNLLNLTPKMFVNYSASQGDYIIITHPTMTAPHAGADQVEAYRAYRSSIAGGSYNAKVYDIEQLVDQFGYGIKKNPLSVKNFLRYARSTFSVAPKYCFIIGKGMTYVDYRSYEYNPDADRLDLVPTWGYPASDVMLASNTMAPVMNTLIGRLSIINSAELAEYLSKVKQYEQVQLDGSQTIIDKAWMKNYVFVQGSGNWDAYMNDYQKIIEDTLIGGKAYNFSKTSTGAATPIINSMLNALFVKGFSMLTYFGHSSSTTFDYNLDEPSNYNNTGKYPLFLVSGCNAGNLFSFDQTRFTLYNSLSEKWVLAPQKGAIGFIASSHFGIDTYLHFYNDKLFKSLASAGFGKSIGFNISAAINAVNAAFGTDNLGGRLHAEETLLHGDPAIIVNSHPKPDFVIEEPQIQIVPNIVSVADTIFKVKVQVYNIGKATGDSIRFQIRHISPNGNDSLIYNKRIKSVRYFYEDSVLVPLVILRDKGQNKITATIDVDNNYDELSEINNTATKEFTIYEDEITPVYPYNYAIVNRTNIKLSASTANPVVTSRQYLMEIDTTELFNSPAKVSKNIVSTGGLIEFDPGILFTDSTIYYWRVAPAAASGNLRWNKSSFVYLNGSSLGFNQSHFYQHTKSNGVDIYIDSATRLWKFGLKPHAITIANQVFSAIGGTDEDFSIKVDGDVKTASACVGHSVIFNVFDPYSLDLLYNQPQPSIIQSGTLGGFMGSGPSCGATRQHNFEFSYMDTAGRRKMRDFMDWIPSGYFVTVRLILDSPWAANPYVATWKNDLPAGNNLYERLKAAGFAGLDDYTYPRTWAFIYRKNNASLAPQYKLSADLNDPVVFTTPVNVSTTMGTISSPLFGPAKAWHNVKWRGYSLEAVPKDIYTVKVLGITAAGTADTLYTLQPNQQDFDINAVSATQYPYIRLVMKNQDMDSIANTPYQLRYWRLIYDPIPEGALAPNLSFNVKDTFELGEQTDLSIAFKNISDAPFANTIKVRMELEDRNHVKTILLVARLKKLQQGDTTIIRYPIDTKVLEGLNTLYVDVNPDNDQPEQYHFNNYLYKNFFVKSDVYNPLMDVTFDGVHILNGDIVSARPKIEIKLKDEAKFLALDDTSLTTVFVRYPDETMRRFAFGTDTLKFIPADVSTGKNEATINFAPAFLQDSEDNFYELIVKAKDKSDNPAGVTEYHVKFQVYNKPMISNMFNYPNPFTSSTAFVFTITGSEVPQNIRIQVMTITGKIVRDITKAELGHLHIGRNITDYKWDGTDQYGSKLGNGIYLYRVLTNLNGASLEKFKTKDAGGNNVDTDKYFNKGYGKMYLMR